MQLDDDGGGLRRQFASWHRDGTGLICFGGFDGRRCSTVARRATASVPWTVLEVAGDLTPPSLQHHRTVLRGRTLVVIGGRTRPYQPSPGLYVMDLDTGRWCQRRVQHDDAGPAPRYRHAVAYDAAGDRAYVSGGIGFGGCLLADLWLLDFADWSWRRLPLAGTATPSARHSHSLTFCGGRLLLFGGLTQVGAGRGTDAALYKYNLDRSEWHRLDVGGDIPPPIYAHVAIAYTDAFVVVVGGIATNSSAWEPNLVLFDSRTRIWIRAGCGVRQHLRTRRLLLGHGVVPGPGPDCITVIGGGATCFSFGRWLDGCVVLDLPQVFDIG